MARDEPARAANASRRPLGSSVGSVRSRPAKHIAGEIVASTRPSVVADVRSATMPDLARAVAELLDQVPAFSGAVRVDIEGATVVAEARGSADRTTGQRNTPATRFAVASVTKTFTALTVVSLVADGLLSLDTTARSLLGGDLPLVDDGVTVGQLLAHRSGIGDYLDEEQMGAITDY